MFEAEHGGRREARASFVCEVAGAWIKIKFYPTISGRRQANGRKAFWLIFTPCFFPIYRPADVSIEMSMNAQTPSVAQFPIKIGGWLSNPLTHGIFQPLLLQNARQ
jgi:hypothetical protein